MRDVCIALDESPESRRCLDFAAQAFLRRSTDVIHLINVLPPTPLGGTAFPPPMGAGVSTAALLTAHQEQAQTEKAQAARSLKMAAELLNADYRVPLDNVQCHILPAAGGASGVADSIVQFTRSKRVDALVLGQRGMGGVKRALMSIVGLGSVSDHCVHRAPCPVMVVRAAPGHECKPCVEALPLVALQPPKHVCISVDESPDSQRALAWALDHLVQPHDTVHLVNVGLAAPYPVLDEPAAVAAAEAQAYAEDRQEALGFGKAVCARAAEACQQHGVMRHLIKTQVLEPEGGASDVGSAIASYAEQKKVDVVVVGSRGMGGMKRSLLAAVGLGSVSDHLVHNSVVPVVVVRGEALNANGPESDSALMPAIREGAEEGPSPETQSRSNSGAVPEGQQGA